MRLGRPEEDIVMKKRPAVAAVAAAAVIASIAVAARHIAGRRRRADSGDFYRGYETAYPAYAGIGAQALDDYYTETAADTVMDAAPEQPAAHAPVKRQRRAAPEAVPETEPAPAKRPRRAKVKTAE
jgi:hypothetical protein